MPPLSPVRANLALLSILGFCSALKLREGSQMMARPSLLDLAAYAQSIQSPKRSLSAFVFSRVDSIDRRAQIRTMWMRVKSTEQMNVTYQFAVCGGKSGKLLVPSADGVSVEEASPEVKSALKQESVEHEDVLYLDCDEGYGRGALTKKVLASMKHYWVNQTSDYFMKIDDDSFLSWSKYMPRLIKAGHPYIYMGIPIGEGVPCRNESFRWYEPWSTFDKPLFPKGMSGGSGYTIGKKLVDIILNTGLGEANILYNEDRSVGVWMDSIVKSGTNVDYEGIDGVDGFWAWDWQHPTELWATWGKYPYTVHHGLEGDTINCLAVADREGDTQKPISNCFKSEVGKHYEPLRCANLNREAQDLQKNVRDQELREQHKS